MIKKTATVEQYGDRISIEVYGVRVPLDKHMSSKVIERINRHNEIVCDVHDCWERDDLAGIKAAFARGKAEFGPNDRILNGLSWEYMDELKHGAMTDD